jgi:hypothetical protein
MVMSSSCPLAERWRCDMDFWIGVLFGTIVGILLMTAVDMYYDHEEEA